MRGTPVRLGYSGLGGTQHERGTDLAGREREREIETDRQTDRERERERERERGEREREGPWRGTPREGY